MRSVAKHSYIKGASGRARAKAHVNYIQYRRGEDRENGKPREFFSQDKERIQGREVKQDIDRLERSKVVVHKVILSPGIQKVDMERYTREVMKEAGREKGLDLDWRAVVHKNTDHDHAHVIVFGKDKNGREVTFDRDDYAKLREAGDRYLERNHYYERFLARDMDRQMQHGHERDRGDNLFEKLVADLNRKDQEPQREQKPYKAKEWDKEKAIEHLPEREKIERDGETYSKYSKLDDLKELAGRLKDGSTERVDDEQYKKLGQWIWTKERAGDDHYERKARAKWDKKEKKKERDPHEAEREFKKLDKDLKRSIKDMERGSGDFGKGYKQRMREAQGRLAADHGHYTSAMEEQRLKDLMERFPDRADDYQKQLDDLKRFDQEQRLEQSRANKWRDFDSLLGENWKTPERDREGKERQEQVKSGPSLEQTGGERAANDLAIGRVHDQMAGDKTQELDKDRDEPEIDRGGR
ncbi:MAG: hypothetical protein HC888_04930 [Candidatus Competibacteraceae bacterium]|nr:hypothetical protein [Candidatus Competibacteraceae bacterium]